jgi:hypothetical protein
MEGKSVFIPALLNQTIISAIQNNEIIKYKFLILSVYYFNFMSNFLGPVLTKAATISYKLIISPVLSYVSSKIKVNDLLNKINQYSQRKATQTRRKKIPKKDESYDDLLNLGSDPVEPPPLPSGSINSQERLDEIAREMQSRKQDMSSSYKSYQEDMKSLKGSQNDIEKLKLYGYNKYRFVSDDFLVRNSLKIQSSKTSKPER